MKRRILFLTTELPWPLDGGGKLRSFETLACLSASAEVRVLSVSESPRAAADRDALAAALPSVEVEPPIAHGVRIRRDPVALARTALAQVLHREPYLVAKFRNRRYLERTREIADTWRPDVVWCDHLNVFPAARIASGAALVLDEHNVESELFRRAAGAPRLLRLAAALEGRRAARYESEALRLADRVIAISDEDAAALVRLGGGDKVRTCLPSVGTVPEILAPPEAPPSVAFLGSLSWPPNAEAARFLAFEVMPVLRKLVPAIQVRIGGRGLDPATEKRMRSAGVELAGYVADAEAFLRSAAVAVVPVLSGSGISIKLLDSLKAGVPTVSTGVGARGIRVRDGHEVLLADGGGPFAQAVARLLGDTALRRRLVASARDYLAAHHGRAALAERYRRIAEEAIEARHGRPDAPRARTAAMGVTP